jgi:hypothetical protein
MKEFEESNADGRVGINEEKDLQEMNQNYGFWFTQKKLS